MEAHGEIELVANIYHANRKKNAKRSVMNLPGATTTKRIEFLSKSDRERFVGIVRGINMAGVAVSFLFYLFNFIYYCTISTLASLQMKTKESNTVIKFLVSYIYIYKNLFVLVVYHFFFQNDLLLFYIFIFMSI